MNGFGVSPFELMASDAMLKGIVRLDEFIYSVPFLNNTDSGIGSGQTKELQLLINGDSDFLVQEQNFSAYDSASPPVVVVNPNLLITVTRSGSGNQLMNNAQHILNWGGGYTGTRYPGRKPTAALWMASNNIAVKVQNLGTTVFSRVDIAFVGVKVFYQSVTLPNGHTITGNRTSVFNSL